MKQHYDMIVIGGGIIGSSVAYHLVLQGKSVLLIDADHTGKATNAGAGIISGATTFSKEEAMYQLVQQSSLYYPEFIELLASDSNLPTGYITSEELLVAFDDSHLNSFEVGIGRILQRQKLHSYPVSDSLKELSAEEVAHRYPAIAPCRKALLYTDAAQVDGRLLNAAIIDAAQSHGTQVVEAHVSDLLLEGDSCKGVIVDEEHLYADTIIISGGAWSTAFKEQLQLDSAIFPQRGQIIHFSLSNNNSSDLPIIISMSDYYLLQWSPTQIVVGATRESDSGFDPTSTVEGVKMVLDEATNMVPTLSQASIDTIRVGLRPYSRDKLPLIGPVSAIDNVWMATGHGPLGLTAGPLTGKLVAEQLCGIEQHDLSSYDPNRFS